MSNIKYIVAPSFSVASYWIKQLGLKERVNIITREEQIIGRYFNKDEIIFIEGEKYDFPELKAISFKYFDKYMNLVLYAKRRIR